MDTATISLVISIIAFIISISIFFILNKKQKIAATEGGDGYTSRPLQLQAYERLVMLSERIALPGLISRVNQPGLTAKEMQLLMPETDRKKFHERCVADKEIMISNFNIIFNELAPARKISLKCS